MLFKILLMLSNQILKFSVNIERYDAKRQKSRDLLYANLKFQIEKFCSNFANLITLFAVLFYCLVCLKKVLPDEITHMPAVLISTNIFQEN